MEYNFAYIYIWACGEWEFNAGTQLCFCDAVEENREVCRQRQRRPRDWDARRDTFAPRCRHLRRRTMASLTSALSRHPNARRAAPQRGRPATDASPPTQWPSNGTSLDSWPSVAKIISASSRDCTCCIASAAENNHTHNGVTRSSNMQW